MDWIPTKDFVDYKDKVRFFKYVDSLQADVCWNWIGHIMNNGYGEFYYKSYPITAHRMSYKIFFGDFPDFALICHRCDNKVCVNPNHLYLGTYRSNLIDSYTRHPETKGRRWYNRRNTLCQ